MKREVVLVAATVVVTAVVGSGISVLWDAVGWTTPLQHKEDLDAAGAVHVTLEQHAHDIEEKLDRNYWTRRCDEWQEDLSDWLVVPEEHRDEQLKEAIRQKQDAIDENDCYKFPE